MKARILSYGLDELEDAFKDLDKMDKRKIIVDSYKKAMRPVVSAIKANTPVGKTRNLINSIGSVAEKEGIAVWTGALVVGGKRGYIGWIVEDGTRNRGYITKNGIFKSTGHLTRTLFMTKAINSSIDNADQIAANEWYSAINRRLKKVK